jgi:hypothetical protein
VWLQNQSILVLWSVTEEFQFPRYHLYMLHSSQKLGRATRDGQSALHLCAIHNKRECMKLLLRIKPDLVNIEDATGLTPLEVAKEHGQDLCVELVSHHWLFDDNDKFDNVIIMKIMREIDQFHYGDQFDCCKFGSIGVANSKIVQICPCTRNYAEPHGFNLDCTLFFSVESCYCRKDWTFWEC